VPGAGEETAQPLGSAVINIARFGFCAAKDGYIHACFPV
jgi:hypothetical protein